MMQKILSKLKPGHILGAGLCVVLMGGGCFLLSQWLHHFSARGRITVALAQENRKAMDWLMHEMLQADTSSLEGVPLDGAWHTTISFKTVNSLSLGERHASQRVTYALRGHTIIRSQSGQEQIIASHVSSFKMRRFAASDGIVEVSLMLKEEGGAKNQNASLSSGFRIKTSQAP